MNTKRIVISAMFLALGIVLPMAFHLFTDGGGKMFLPMHLPILIAGFIVGPFYGMFVGILSPLISGVITGMPPLFPMGLIMSFELGSYGFFCGYLFKKYNKILLSLISSMIIGRVVAGIVVFLFVNLLNISFAPPVTFVTTAVATGIPGIIIQIILIPIILTSFRANGLINLGR